MDAVVDGLPVVMMLAAFDEGTTYPAAPAGGFRRDGTC
jgi:hypothetical protein